ncbi:capsular polysaccharide export protein [Sphingobium sp. OAS761]|uniref:capsular polysaccharide export protein, LipB/KpsS family n=1 Tax=Sphingobium sp. OAS761 TaxID=2817901 RepID=UPI00209C92C9|nr:beta-3-deoxy-D-manno-oct-2-ulosonic acid transferase [Sphingobium sp. OAS761]MCP1468492.1 capsular polysaccharide export protein [Sphingobium sp. OAS761]
MPPTSFLRSPPFPGIPSTVAAISDKTDAVDDATAVDDAMIDALAQARVGGCFWGDKPQGLRIVIGADMSVPASALAGVMPDEIGLIRSRNGQVPRMPGRAIGADCDPWALLAQARALWAAPGDELALVAGVLGVPVFTSHGRKVDPAQLRLTLRKELAAARYRNPFTGAPADTRSTITQLADWRRHLDGNRDIAAASGMAFWKREAIRHFLWDGRRAPPFLPAARGLRRARQTGQALAIWPSRVPADTVQEASAAGVPIARVEDGFLRSRGLGAALHPPGSVVVDRRGIYYNARVESDLERLLATHDFPALLVDRARALRTRICMSGVTKYGAGVGRAIDLPAGRRTVLAVGQVDDDMSVRLGGAGVDGNLDFLARVRRAEPDAFIIYRPHPDVQAGHRKGHLAESAVLAHADAIDAGSPLMPLVQAVDDVHVLSSLTGFEALMRGCRVTVHGMPFYAGWGLTRDLAQPSARRGRSLTLDQLVAAALILYPRYLDPVTRLPCGPEVMVDRLADGSTPPVTWLIRLRAAQGKLRRFMTLSAEYLHG